MRWASRGQCGDGICMLFCCNDVGRHPLRDNGTIRKIQLMPWMIDADARERRFHRSQGKQILRLHDDSSHLFIIDAESMVIFCPCQFGC